MPAIGKRKAEGSFQITIHDSARVLRLKLAGRLAGGDVFDVESCWRTAASTIAGRRLVVDVTDLASVDAGGRMLLARMRAERAEFAGDRPEIGALPGEAGQSSSSAAGESAAALARSPTASGTPRGPNRIADTGPAASSMTRRVPPAERTAISALVLGFLACLIALAWTTGVTVDEPSHFLSARLYWEGRDNLRPGDVPPLMKIVSGWVPLVMDARMPPASHTAWKDRDEWILALVMMEGMSASEVRHQFFLARLPMLIFPLGCCLLIWWWGRQIFSPWAAVAAAALFCISPTVLGHGPLVKNDLAASFGYLLFWYRTWRFWRAPGWRNAAWLGAGLLCAVLAKYSLTVLLPVAAAVVAARYALMPRRSLSEAMRGAGVCALVVCAGMLTAWQFRMEPVTFRELQQWKADPGIPTVVPKAIRVASILPVPGAFWRGGVSLISSNHSAGGYLLGKTEPGGHPLYFLIAMAVKLPVAAQVLIAAAVLWIALAVVRRRLPPGYWCWALPGFLYLGLASMSGLQLGIRLVLPAIVFFILMTGKAFELAASRTALKVLTVVLVAGSAARTASAYPNYISFFNLWVGDAWHGLRVLSDSNIDWGQDLRALQRWHRSSGVGRFTLSYFGAENVFSYFNDEQMECVRPPWNAETAQGRRRIALRPGYYAISATLISGQFFPPEYRDYYAAFRQLEPVARAGNSIFIFRVTRSDL